MKVSNETKVGALAAVSITLLILGFNFLKGKNLLSKANTEIYAVFQKVDGLNIANPVTINGLQIGKVYEMHEKTVISTGSLLPLTSKKILTSLKIHSPALVQTCWGPLPLQ